MANVTPPTNYTLADATAWPTTITNAMNAANPGGYIPGVRARRTTTQSVSNVTNTVLSWDSEDYDTNTFHSTSSNTSRLTVPASHAGIYNVGYYFDIGAGTGVVAAWVTVNGAGSRFAYQQVMNGTTNGPLLNGSDFIGLNVGDYVELNVYQNSGGALNTAGTSASFHMYRVGPKA